MYITNIHAVEINLWPTYKNIQPWSEMSQQVTETGRLLFSEASTTVFKVLKRQVGRTEGSQGRQGPPRDAAAHFPLISPGDSA